MGNDKLTDSVDVGTVGLLDCRDVHGQRNGMKVAVRVLAVTPAYGRLLCVVVPLAGAGEMVCNATSLSPYVEETSA